MSHPHSSWLDLPPFHFSTPPSPSQSDEQPQDPRTPGRFGRLAFPSPLTGDEPKLISSVLCLSAPFSLPRFPEKCGFWRWIEKVQRVIVWKNSRGEVLFWELFCWLVVMGVMVDWRHGYLGRDTSREGIISSPHVFWHCSHHEWVVLCIFSTVQKTQV